MIGLAGSALVLTLSFFSMRRSPRRLPYPPGPRGYPVIGNILDLPTEFQFKAFHDLASKYGDMIYYTVLGQPILVLNSLKCIEDLLEKRSVLYSDRPKAPMLRDLMGWNEMLLCMDQGPQFRLYRKTFTHHFSQHALVLGAYGYHQRHLDEMHKLIGQLMQRPDDILLTLVRPYSATFMAQLIYSIDIKVNTEYATLIQSMVKSFEEAAIPGRFLVDRFPILRHIPHWLPGAKFQRFARESKQVWRDLQQLPFELVEERMKGTLSVPCIASEMIENLANLEGSALQEQRTVLLRTCAIAYTSGTDTTYAALKTFLYAMAAYPSIQSRAQHEIDTHLRTTPVSTGPSPNNNPDSAPGRLPAFTDKPHLPYLTATIKEVLRWISILPLAFPHVLSQNDEYEGYLIPKGTLVIPNSWAVQHNAQIYEDPFTFNPDRFLDPKRSGVLDPTGPAFGYGRR
ncbi:cytochrome P450 [Coprinopsis marcescibilis]|uniref:Cytochrome P450 n=1 Tax=Coprinopsis marcescibilis TaxID=230819 RepID=A0A5C3L596_COPMA|nr:cytochrome P450 [Coprinopsis marcescibilis]